MTPSLSNSGYGRTLTPQYGYGGVMCEQVGTHPEFALAVVVATQENLLVVDHVATIYGDVFQPLYPVWWLRYLQISGQPPADATLKDQTQPIQSVIGQLARNAYGKARYPLTGVAYPAALAEFYQAVQPDWTPLKHSSEVCQMVFREVRTYLPDLLCAPLQFRAYAYQHPDVYSNANLQAAIGLAVLLHRQNQQTADIILSGSAGGIGRGAAVPEPCPDLICT